jgi:hypothetical protein
MMGSHDDAGSHKGGAAGGGEVDILTNKAQYIDDKKRKEIDELKEKLE